MSLSALNNPSLIATLGSSVLVAVPLLDEVVQRGSLSWNALRVLNLASYALNNYATSRPGRFDSPKDEKSGSKKSDDSLADEFGVEKEKSLVTPSRWAFYIWGPIFLGEAVLVTSQFLIPESSFAVATLKEVSAPFIGAQLFQSLWAASFRPKYKGRLMYISTAMLGGIAICLSKSHWAFAKLSSSRHFTFGQYCLFFLPISLHFGWTTAATLVNLNSAYVKQENVSPKSISLLGYVSAVAATCTGVAVTVKREAPVFGGVVSWALFALADGMKTRLQCAPGGAKANDERTGLRGAQTQKVLCTAGGCICLGVSAITAAAMTM